jgi:hypothetical protein
LNGDGSFGQNAMELDTAVRHQLPLLCIISLNGGWTAEPEGNGQGGWGGSFALRLASRRPLLFQKNPAGNPALAADFLGFGEAVKQNYSEKQRTKTAKNNRMPL